MTSICRHQILKMNGFSPADFDSKKQAKLVEHLLKESESFYGHDRQKQDGAMEELNRYYYRTLVTHTSSCSSNQSQELVLNAELSNKQLKELKQEGEVVKQEGEVEIKLEFPKKQELKHLLAQANCFLKKLEAKNSGLQKTLLEVETHPTLSKSTQCQELAKVCTEFEAFLKEFRRATVILEKKTDLGEPEAEKELQNLKGWMDRGATHMDGSTTVLTRAKGWLS